jgi:hypothetical protein
MVNGRLFLNAKSSLFERESSGETESRFTPFYLRISNAWRPQSFGLRQPVSRWIASECVVRPESRVDQAETSVNTPRPDTTGPIQTPSGVLPKPQGVSFKNATP